MFTALQSFVCLEPVQSHGKLSFQYPRVSCEMAFKARDLYFGRKRKKHYRPVIGTGHLTNSLHLFLAVFFFFFLFLLFPAVFFLFFVCFWCSFRFRGHSRRRLGNAVSYVFMPVRFCSIACPFVMTGIVSYSWDLKTPPFRRGS